MVGFMHFVANVLGLTAGIMIGQYIIEVFTTVSNKELGETWCERFFNKELDAKLVFVIVAVFLLVIPSGFLFSRVEKIRTAERERIEQERQAEYNDLKELYRKTESERVEALARVKELEEKLNNAK